MIHRTGRAWRSTVRADGTRNRTSGEGSRKGLAHYRPVDPWCHRSRRRSDGPSSDPFGKLKARHLALLGLADHHFEPKQHRSSDKEDKRSADHTTGHDPGHSTIGVSTRHRSDAPVWRGQALPPVAEGQPSGRRGVDSQRQRLQRLRLTTNRLGRSSNQDRASRNVDRTTPRALRRPTCPSRLIP